MPWIGLTVTVVSSSASPSLRDEVLRIAPTVSAISIETPGDYSVPFEDSDGIRMEATASPARAISARAVGSAPAARDPRRATAKTG